MNWNDKVKVRAYYRSYYLAHRERIKARSKAYYLAHLERRKITDAAYREAHREEHRVYARAHYEANREEYRANMRAYNALHLKERATREQRRRLEDMNYRLACNLRVRMAMAIRQDNKAGSAVRDLGMSIPEFREYIQARFEPGMSWENYGEWHLDHIRPLASFDLTDREQFLQVAHYTNYQPLWGPDNSAKGAKC